MFKVNTKEALMSVAGIGAGAAASRMIGMKVLPDMKPEIKGALKMAVGAFVIPSVVRHKMAAYVGDGMIAEGVLQILEAKAPEQFKVSGITEDVMGSTDAYVVDAEVIEGNDSEFETEEVSGLDEEIEFQY